MCRKRSLIVSAFAILISSAARLFVSAGVTRAPPRVRAQQLRDRDAEERAEQAAVPPEGPEQTRRAFDQLTPQRRRNHDARGDDNRRDDVISAGERARDRERDERG